MADVLKEEGISTATLYYWRQQLRRSGAAVPNSNTLFEQWSAQTKLAIVAETVLVTPRYLFTFTYYAPKLAINKHKQTNDQCWKMSFWKSRKPSTWRSLAISSSCVDCKSSGEAADNPFRNGGSVGCLYQVAMTALVVVWFEKIGF